MHKVFCLLSGGADSSTTLSIAANEYPNDSIEAVTIDYGQRHKREVVCAEQQAEAFGADHVVIDAKGFMTGMLVDKGDKNEAIPEVAYADLDKGMSPTYVSFRNGLMMSILAARAQAWVMARQVEWDAMFEICILQGDACEMGDKPHATLYLGVHADDGVNWAYPDCTPEFVGPMSAAIYVGTYHKVRVRAPLLYMTKPGVIEQGTKFGVNFANTWSCYKGEDIHCGVCPTCRSRKEAFELNGLQDPTEYAA